MQVYIVVTNNWQDYEGGGGEIVAVFAKREDAFAKVKELLPSNLANKAKGDAEEWHFPPEPASSYWLTIEVFEVE
jgi:hypothetical protein